MSKLNFAHIKSLIKRYAKNTTVIHIGTVAVIALVVKGFGFLKEIVVAGTFGLSELLDTFFIAALVPLFIYEVFINTFNKVFIPNYIAEQKSQNKTSALQGTSLVFTIAISLLFMLLAFLFTDVYLKYFFAGHTDSYYLLIKTQFYYLLPCILFWGLASLLSGLLNIYDEFAYSTIYPIITSISIIICLWFFKEQLAEKVLAIGMLAGAIVQFLFLLIIAISKNIVDISYPRFKDHNAVIMFKQIPAKVSSSLLNGINPFVDQYFSAQLIIGSIAALNFGNKIPMFAISIVTLALGNVLLPYFSKLSIDSYSESFIQLKRILKIIITGSFIVVIVLFLLSNPVISLLFERNEFTSNDTLVVSKVQQMYLFQIPFYITGVVMIRFLTAINKNNYMVFTSLVSLILNIVLNFILIKTMGVYGLALATSIVSLTNTILLYMYINRLQNEPI